MPQNFQKKILSLIHEQIHDWPLASHNYDGLKETETCLLTGNEKPKIFVQFNPARIRSSAAKVDAHSISQRPCFLCQENLPEEQKGVAFNDQYTVLVNPFPIFRQHLTIPHSNHIPQRIHGKVGDMLELARELPGFVLFYNGPRCGASAPDHFHFQAIGKGSLPLEDEVAEALQNERPQFDNEFSVVAMEKYGRKALVVKSDKTEEIEEKFGRVYQFLQAVQPQEAEPMLNVLCWQKTDGWVLVILPRQAHRPWQYDADEPENIVLSPASVDLGGVLITPRKEDFENLNIETVQNIFSQVSIDDESWKELKQFCSK